MLKKRLMAVAAGLICMCALGTRASAQETEQPVVEAPEIEATVLQPEETPQLDMGDSGNSGAFEKTIHDNIYLGDIDLSGMSRQEASEVVEKRMEEITGYGIVLQMEDQMVAVPAKDMGVTGDNEDMIRHAMEIGQAGNIVSRFKASKDLENTPVRLPMNYTVDKEQVRQVVEEQCVPYNRSAVDYDLTREGNEFKIITGQRGFKVKVDESVDKVTEYLENEWRDGPGSVWLDLEIEEPKGSVEELGKVKDKIGSGSTDYAGGSAGRAANIVNATQMINGLLLYPGEAFSVCNAITPFTEENGYQKAASYENGTTVETYGGGICQVSTTLYLAVMRAELEVLERHNHSMSVGYVKTSMDAAIAEGVKDFQFRNNLDAPIYVEGYAGGGNLGFVIYGEEYRPQGRTVTYENEILETIDPEVELEADSTLPYGYVQMTQSSHTGYVAKLWKVVTENGKTEKTEYNRSNYMMSPTKYSVGIKTDSQEALAAMYDAIATNDINEVYVAVSKYAAGA